MRIETIRSTILILLVVLSATAFSAVKKSYKTMTTAELEEEVKRLEEKAKLHEEKVKRQQLIREINKGCSDPSKLIGGAQERAQWLADREKARREEWHKRNMKAREDRLRSNVNYRNSQKNIDKAPTDFSEFSPVETTEEAYINSAQTDLERSFRQNVVAVRQLVENKEINPDYKKQIRFITQQQREIENEARAKGEDWAR